MKSVQWLPKITTHQCRQDGLFMVAWVHVIQDHPVSGKSRSHQSNQWCDHCHPTQTQVWLSGGTQSHQPSRCSLAFLDSRVYVPEYRASAITVAVKHLPSISQPHCCKAFKMAHICTYLIIFAHCMDMQAVNSCAYRKVPVWSCVCCMLVSASLAHSRSSALERWAVEASHGSHVASKITILFPGVDDSGPDQRSTEFYRWCRWKLQVFLIAASLFEADKAIWALVML